MYKFILIILLVCSQFIGYGQIKSGHKLFDKFHYSEAIDYYLKHVDDKDQDKRFDAMDKLTQCYIQVNDVPNSIYWSEKLIESPKVYADVYYRLGKLLVKNEDYVDAETYFSKYSMIDSTDFRGEIYAQYCRDIDQLGEDKTAEIQNVEILNSEYSEFSPIKYDGKILLSTDRDIAKTDVYGWTSFGYHQMFRTQYLSDDVFVFPENEPESVNIKLNKQFHSGPLSISEDRSTFFITRTVRKSHYLKKSNNHVVHLSLYYGKLVDGKVEMREEFPYNFEEYSTGHATLSKDGKKVIYSSDEPGGYGHADLYMSEYIDEEWTKPVNLGESINAFADEVFPYWYNDSTLYFASDSHFGYGGLDCFVTYKTAEGWSKPENLLKPVNSSYDDFGIYVMEGEMQGYISSDRPNGLGSDDIYAFKRGIPSKDKILCGYVKNRISMEPMDSAMVFALSTSTRQVHIAQTNAAGYFEIYDPEGELFVLHAMKKGYLEDIYQFRIDRDGPPKQCLDRDLLLEPKRYDTPILTRNIYYDLDKDFIRTDAALTMDTLITMMQNKRYDIALSSHTDIRASDEYNIDLSNRRAKKAKIYLVQHGIDGTRILMRGYGEKQPAIVETDARKLTEPEHQMNRRTEFHIVLHRENNIQYNFDYSKLRPGDILPVEMFPIGFFGSVTEYANILR